MHIGLSMLCGPSIAQGNMGRSLAEALNVNRRRIALSAAQEKSVHVPMLFLMRTNNLPKISGPTQVYHAQQATRRM